MKKNLLGIILLILWLAMLSCSRDKSNSTYTGIVEGKVYSLSSPISDDIIAMPVQEGTAVSKGQLVALIDTTSIVLQIRQAETAQEELQFQLQNVDLKYNQAKTSYQYFVDKYNKNMELSRTNAIPSQTLKDIELQMTNFKDQLDMAALNKKIFAKKLDQTRYQLQLLQEKLDKAYLRAPVPGIVDKIYYDRGEIPAPFATVADIVNLDNVWCYIYLAETDLAQVSIGQDVTIHVDGFDKTLSGKVSYINQQAEFTPKTIMTPDNRKAFVFGVKIAIVNEDHILKPGMPVQVSL